MLLIYLVFAYHSHSLYMKCMNTCESCLILGNKHAHIFFQSWVILCFGMLSFLWNPPQTIDPFLQDVDFTRQDEKIRVGEERKAKLVAQIERDSPMPRYSFGISGACQLCLQTNDPRFLQGFLLTCKVHSWKRTMSLTIPSCLASTSPDPQF